MTDISIHALLAESDLILHMAHLMEHLFLSTLSLRRATSMRTDTVNNFGDFYPRSPCGERRYLINTYHRIFGISIHALLAESDPHNTKNNCIDCCISIHALLAESDLTIMIYDTSAIIFLSTLSLRRAT